MRGLPHIGILLPSPVSPVDARAARWAPWSVAIGTCVAAVGWVAEDILGELPAERVVLSLLLSSIAGVLAWPLRRWLRWPWAGALAVVWLAGLVFFVGLPAILAVLVLALAALALGLALLPAAMPGRVGMATTLGLTLMAGITGWVITLPIHYRWSWGVLLIGILCLRFSAVRGALTTAACGWRAAVAASPRWAAAAVTMAGLVCTACWMPTMQIDDLAYHLNLPTQLLFNAGYAPDPEHQVWSYAPWMGDLLHGVVFTLSGQRSHGGMNSLWLLLGGINAWALLSALGARASERWAAISLLASFPPLLWMAAGMQTELPATALLLALMAITFQPQPLRFGLQIGAVLFGGLFALKLLHGIVALPLAAVLVWNQRPQRPVTTTLVTLVLFLAVASSSYVQGWLATGNPILPMANAVFQSPYFPVENYRDVRWFTGLSPLTPWHMLFDTSRYVEVDDGALGFAGFALAGLLLAALRRPGPVRAAAWVALAMLSLTLIPMQYARYAYPCMALLLLMPLIGSERLLSRRAFTATAALACLLNLAWQANASWLHDTAAFKRTLRSGGDPAQIMPPYTPQRLLVGAVPRQPEHIVLSTDPHHNAAGDMGRQGIALSGHAPHLALRAAQAEQSGSAEAWRDLLVTERVRWLLLTTAHPPAGLREALLDLQAQPHSQSGGVELWALPHPYTGAP